MNIKKSKIYEMIKEELEVILTNDEAHEIFDLDAGALLDAMMKEVVTVSTKDIVESTQFPTSSDTPRGKGAGGREPSIKLDKAIKRPGTHPADRAGTRNPGTWAQREKLEILEKVKSISADGDYKKEEKESLLLVQALEGIVTEVLNILFQSEESWKRSRQAVMNASVQFQKKLASMAQSELNRGEEGGDEQELPLPGVTTEAWKGDPEIKQTGEWADKTTEELCARKKTLMKQKSRTELEQKEVREINFAIRSKQKGPKFGKVGC